MFKKLSFKKRSLLFVEAVLLALVAWGLVSLPPSFVTVAGIVAWCMVALLLIVVIGTYCVYKHRHWLCFLGCLFIMAGAAHADIAYIQVEPMSEGENQCHVVAKARTAAEGDSEVTQEQLDTWMQEGLDIFKPFQCDECQKQHVSSEYETKMKQMSAQKGLLETEKPWDDEKKKQVFLIEATLAYYQHCKMFEDADGCKTPRQYAEDDQKDCYTCMLVGLAITAVDVTTLIFEGYVSQYMLVVLALCFCLWLMWMVARCLIGVDDGVTFAGAVFAKVLWFILIVLLLQQPVSWVLETLTVPFARLSGWMAQVTSDATALGETTSPISTTESRVAMPNYCADNTQWDSSKYLKYIPRYQQSDKDVSILGPEIKNAVMCPVYNNFKVVVTSLAVGQALTCRARYVNSGTQAEDEADKHVFADVNLMVTGLILTIASYFIMFLLPYFMVEVVLRMALFFVPFPIWCLALMYKPTRGFATRAFTVFVHALLCLVTLSIAAAFITEAFVTVVTPTAEAAIIIRNVLNDPKGSVEPLVELFSVSKNFKMAIMFIILSWFTYRILALSVLFADKILGASMGSAASAFGASVHKSFIAIRDAVRKAITDAATPS
ncbi:MAG: hypothetical protein ILP11_01720 [Alphaproteobacteria bacterium]|nr:hypothetical protein [Alphaproteobacteria bacterium]